MQRTRHAITLLTVWLTILLVGPVLPALASSCGSFAKATSAPTLCPMKHGVANTADRTSCCCSAKSNHSLGPGAGTVSKAQSNCACTVKPGVPVTSNEMVQAPPPDFAVALFDVPTIAAIPPLAHFAANAPLPPFAARLRLPQRARDAGRAPPTA